MCALLVPLSIVLVLWIVIWGFSMDPRIGPLMERAFTTGSIIIACGLIGIAVMAAVKEREKIWIIPPLAGVLTWLICRHRMIAFFGLSTGKGTWLGMDDFGWALVSWATIGITYLAMRILGW